MGELSNRQFSKNDSGFTCAHCGRKVEPLGYSSRNHCPFCLWSLHLDNNPGDRESDCKGPLEPIKVETDPKKGYIIVHRCQTCGAIRRCKAAHEAPVQPDDINLLIKLTVADYAGK